MAKRVLSEVRRVARGPVIIRVPVRKDSEPVLAPITDDELVQGRLFEHELVDLFRDYGFAIEQKKLISERDAVYFAIYVLKDLDGSLANGAAQA